MTEQTRGYREGARAVAPLAIAVGAFGISFGVLARAAGMGVLAPILMSMTTFAGSAQFAAVSVLGAGGAAATAVIAALLLNARYLPLGITIAPWLEGGVWSRLLHAHLMVDESWAVAAEGEGRWNPRVLLAAGAGIWIAWVAGTAIGVASGDLIGDPAAFGMDAAFPALFLALLAPMLRGGKVHAFPGVRFAGHRPIQAAVLGAAIALALTPFTPEGIPIVAASLACLLGLIPQRRREVDT
ncbi:MAG TPA: AzlC family ABC transporter permease [Actinomycetota bacterium]|nr:AzlC family ABC transporter permease [Actinomycetota bacterium]